MHFSLSGDILTIMSKRGIIISIGEASRARFTIKNVRENEYGQ